MDDQRIEMNESINCYKCVLKAIEIDAKAALKIFDENGFHPSDEDIKRAICLVVDILVESQSPSLFKEHYKHD